MNRLNLVWNPNREMFPFPRLTSHFFEDLAEVNEKWVSPALDLEETKGHYLLSIDMPGIPKEDVKIEVLDGQLVISGERKRERDTEENAWHVAERSIGKFQRKIKLPELTDASQIEAAYTDGVLKIAIPKAEAKKPKVVEIKTEQKEGGFFSKLLGSKEENARETKLN